MLSSITPLGERGRSSRWPVTVAAYVAASTAAATLLGTVLGAGGALLAAVGGLATPAWRPGAGGVLLALAALSVVGLALDLRVVGLRLPGPARQVDEDWLARYRGWVYGAGFGAQLGLGVVTIVTSSSLYLVWAAALLSASATAGAVLGAAFGLARALPVLAVRRVGTPQQLASAFAGLERARPVAHAGALAAVAALVPVAALLVVTGATTAQSSTPGPAGSSTAVPTTAVTSADADSADRSTGVRR